MENRSEIPPEVQRKIEAAVREAVEQQFNDPDFLTERFIRWCYLYWQLQDKLEELEREAGVELPPTNKP